jgi:hypothetical protein
MFTFRLHRIRAAELKALICRDARRRPLAFSLSTPFTDCGLKQVAGPLSLLGSVE